MNPRESGDNEQQGPLLPRETNDGSLQGASTMRRPVKKILLLGFNNVGKSALATKFVCDYFQENSNSTIEENFKKTVKYLKIIKIWGNNICFLGQIQKGNH